MDQKEIIYQKYLSILKEKLIKKYDDLGLRASGKYADELEDQLSINKLVMLGSNHAGVMQTGRAAGKFPPYNPQTGTFDEISEWIDTKSGLPSVFKEKKKQFAFLIARKIATEGIKVPNNFNKGGVIEDVVNDFLANDIAKMIEELGDVFLISIKADILKIFKELQT
jgi:hypothetical protein